MIELVTKHDWRERKNDKYFILVDHYGHDIPPPAEYSESWHYYPHELDKLE